MAEPSPSDCTLHKVHHPSVAVLHHVKIDNEAWQVCGTGMDNLRQCVAYMQGQGPSPLAKIGRPTWDLAQRVIDSQTALPNAPSGSVG